MSEKEIPGDVRRLISTHIRTVNDVEVLLLLVDRPKEWSGQEVGEEMYISPESSQALLESLHGAGLISRKEGSPPRYFYDSSIAADRTVRLLAEVYSRMRVRVIEMIYQSPRTTIQSFSDAFKFRKDRE